MQAQRGEGPVTTGLLSDGGSLLPIAVRRLARSTPCPAQRKCPWFVVSAPRPRQTPTETAQLLPATLQRGGKRAEGPARCPERWRGGMTVLTGPGVRPGDRVAGLGPWSWDQPGRIPHLPLSHGRRPARTQRGPMRVGRGGPGGFVDGECHPLWTPGPTLTSGRVESKPSVASVSGQAAYPVQATVSLGTKVC